VTIEREKAEVLPLVPHQSGETQMVGNEEVWGNRTFLEVSRGHLSKAVGKKDEQGEREEGEMGTPCSKAKGKEARSVKTEGSGGGGGGCIVKLTNHMQNETGPCFGGGEGQVLKNLRHI